MTGTWGRRGSGVGPPVVPSQGTQHRVSGIRVGRPATLEDYLRTPSFRLPDGSRPHLVSVGRRRLVADDGSGGGPLGRRIGSRRCPPSARCGLPHG